MPEEDYVGLLHLTRSDDYEPTSVVPNHGELIIIPECPPEGCPVCAAPINDGKGCTNDDVCAEGLSCYNRRGETDTGKWQVTGCSGLKATSYGYCYTKDKAYVPPQTPHRTQPPPNDEFVLTNEVQAPEECSIYAVDRDKTIDVPFSGSSGKFFSVLLALSYAQKTRNHASRYSIHLTQVSILLHDRGGSQQWIVS